MTCTSTAGAGATTATGAGATYTGGGNAGRTATVQPAASVVRAQMRPAGAQVSPSFPVNRVFNIVPPFLVVLLDTSCSEPPAPVSAFTDLEIATPSAARTT